MKLIGDAHFVLLGEASHGAHEFYRERAQITKRLIKEKGFNVVAVEADWPDAYRVNRYVRGFDDDKDAAEALGGFRRFPSWMWRNADVLDFVGWLREHNDGLASDTPRVGFYGLDLYSLHTSIEAVLKYLDKVDSEGARRARARYSCFDHFGEDLQAYGYATGFGLSESCENEAIDQLLELRRRAKVVVWAHNSHLGDARATDMGAIGELNVGQLVRERYGRDATLVGFTTYGGTVTAASNWDGPAERKQVRPALPSSYEAIFHDVGLPRFLLTLRDGGHAATALREKRLERAIGVIYLPESEYVSHYFCARLADQFDAVLHFDKTRAVEPLERASEWEAGEAPETFPTAL